MVGADQGVCEAGNAAGRPKSRGAVRSRRLNPCRRCAHRLKGETVADDVLRGVVQKHARRIARSSRGVRTSAIASTAGVMSDREDVRALVCLPGRPAIRARCCDLDVDGEGSTDRDASRQLRATRAGHCAARPWKMQSGPRAQVCSPLTGGEEKGDWLTVVVARAGPGGVRWQMPRWSLTIPVAA